MGETAAASYRAVLIGIDAYSSRPLRGCVNDIDQIESVLRDRLEVPEERITRLAAPADGAATTSRLNSMPPTCENIRRCLSGLARRENSEDRVLIYYSGHGTQVMRPDARGRLVAREALLPLDFQAPQGPDRLLYDFELNRLLSDIASHVGHLTVVLDACHSASATRGDEEADGVRYHPVDGVQASDGWESASGGAGEADANWRGEVQDLALCASSPASGMRSFGVLSAVEGYVVAAACRANESAREVPVATGSSRIQGAFTQTLVQLLGRLDSRKLAELRWSEIWTALLDGVSRRSVQGQQNPLLVGAQERRIFGGPWTPRDSGYTIRALGDRYQIDAGSLAGVTPGAEVAIYGETPPLFPRVGSTEDQAARLGLVRIESGDRASATAVALGPNFELPAGARARVVQPGIAERLAVALEPFDAELARTLDGPDFKVLKPDRDEAPEARILRRDRQLLLVNETSGNGVPPLATLWEDELNSLHALLRHYARVNGVLRFNRRCTEGGLRLTLLDCTDVARLRKADPQDPDLPEFAIDSTKGYQLLEGQGFAVGVENLSRDALHVTVFNCAGAGCVELLGDDEIPANQRHVFWRGALGTPFNPETAGSLLTVDRLIAIGTTRADQDLRYLAVAETFDEILRAMRGGEKTMIAADPVREAVREFWTTHLVTVRIAKPQQAPVTRG